MQQRYYEPIAGRFLSVDPVTTDANTGGHFSRYDYVSNNPFKFIDPDGRAKSSGGGFGFGWEEVSNFVDATITGGYGLQFKEAAKAGNYGEAGLKLTVGVAYGILYVGTLGEGAVVAAAGKGLTFVAKGESLIYRAASGTPASMTPRAVDAKGLSAADSLANALPGKNQIIDTSKFKSLCAVCDNSATGHVSITPKDMSQMQGWINSRGGVEAHPLTRELMDAVVGTVKK
jgi:uncharacterized protein RhaS with RHS repeats